LDRRPGQQDRRRHLPATIHTAPQALPVVPAQHRPRRAPGARGPDAAARASRDRAGQGRRPLGARIPRAGRRRGARRPHRRTRGRTRGARAVRGTHTPRALRGAPPGPDGTQRRDAGAPDRQVGQEALTGGTTMSDSSEHARKHAAGIARLAMAKRLSIGAAESLTSGAIASALGEAEEASSWFRGAVVAYASQVKFDVLGVAPGPVVTAECGAQMARGARELLGADWAVAVTGAGGPGTEEGQPPGT